MVDFVHMRGRVLAWLCLWFAVVVVAHAATGPVWIVNNIPGVNYATADAACTASWAALSASDKSYYQGYKGPTNSTSSGSCLATFGGGKAFSTLTLTTGELPPVPCTDKTGYNIVVKLADGSGFPNHDALCKVVIDFQIRCWTKAGTTDTYCSYYVHKTGDAYSAPTPAPAVPPAEPVAVTQAPADIPSNMPPTKADTSGLCPKGTVVGGTDSAGTPICMGTGTNTDVTKPVTTTSPPVVTTDSSTGAKTQVDVTKQTNADGSVSTTTVTTVTAADGTKTVSGSTTTGNTAAGSPGVKNSAADDSKNDLCAQHPELNLCKNSTVAGTCAAVACTGDAIQCALLRSTADANCKTQADIDTAKASDQYKLAGQAAAGNDPLKASFPTAANGAQVSMSGIDQSGWIGGGSCFVDKTFYVQGHAVTIPFSKTCDYLVALRYAVMVVALLGSFKIVSGAVIRS